MQSCLHLGLGGQGGMRGKTDRRRQMADQGRNLAQARAALLQLGLQRIGVIENTAQFASSRGMMALTQPDNDNNRPKQEGGYQQIWVQDQGSSQDPSLPVAATTGNCRRNPLKLWVQSIACVLFI